MSAPAYRGRLIFPMLAELFQLDTEATAADPDGAGPLTSGYDTDFREPVALSGPSQAVESARVEKDPIRLPCQVEPDTFEALNALFSGNAPKSEIALVFHFRDLELKSLVDSTSGEALIKPGDRLGGIFDIKNVLVQTIPEKPGLFVTEAKPIGFGLDMAHPHRNLLMVTFNDRERGVET